MSVLVLFVLALSGFFVGNSPSEISITSSELSLSSFVFSSLFSGLLFVSLKVTILFGVSLSISMSAVSSSLSVCVGD